MRPKNIHRDRAKKDIVEIAVHIASDNVDAALRFFSAAEDAVDFLMRTPGAGAARTLLHPALSGLRIWPIRGFENYLILYIETKSSIEVVRVLHAARDLQDALQAE